MARKTRGIVTQIKLEDTFNTAPTFADSDVVVVNEATINPKTDMVDRKIMNCSIVKENGVPVRFTTDGNISVEINADTSGDDTDFFGAVLFEAGLGYKYLPGHDSDDTNNHGKGGFVGKDHAGNDSDQVALADDDTSGTDVVYTLQPAKGETEERKSVAIRKFYDADDVCLQATGIVVNKVDISAPTADIVTASFGVEGCDYTTPDDQTKPACNSVANIPFVGKSATFKYGDNSVNAMDVSFSITNQVTNEEGITGSGYTNKFIVEKQVTGSFKVLFDDFSYLDDLKNQTSGTLYLKVKAGDNEFGVYFPQIKLSDFQVTDNSNMLVEATVNFVAETKKDLNPSAQACLIGIK